MKSNKQRRAELKAKKIAKRVKAELAAKLNALTKGVEVDRSALAPDNSYSVPAFVERGYYVDLPLECQDCGEPQTWTAAQQKWWYEVAKGNVWTTARLCRPCRRRERARREESQRVSLEGLERKQRNHA
jgi:hypothetical protein